MASLIGSVRQPCDEGVIAARSASAPCSAASAPWILAATIIGSALVFIDSSVANLVLPALQAELGATLVDVQWVVESYALVLGALMLVGGSLGDRLGRRRVFIAGLLLFSAGSIWCGFAPNVGQLIAARCVQGVGGVLLTPTSLAILSASFDDQERGRAIGTWSGSTAIFAAIGPLLGGYLIQHASWRWVFFINVPLVAAAVWIAFVHLRESRDTTAPKPLDIPGALLATLGLGAIVFGLIQSTALTLAHPLVLGCIAGGLGTLAVFLIVERHSPAPMVPLGLFRSRTFTGVNVLTLLLYGALGGALFFLPFDLMQVQGYSPSAAGASLLPFILLMFLFSRWAGGLIPRVGVKLPLVVGPAVAGFGLALFALPDIGGSYWTTYFPAVMVLGIGMAIAVAPLTTTVMTAAGKENAGIASGINNAVSRVASLLAVAALSLVLWTVFNHDLDGRLARVAMAPDVRAAFDAERIKMVAAKPPASVSPLVARELENATREAYVAGFRVVMIVGALLAFSGALSAALLIPKR